MLAALICVCAVLGLAVGSFLNVVVYRVPLHESIVSPGSHCPSCSSPILARDNIPLVSWALLRGRCRNCHARIALRYPLIELLAASLFAGLAARLGLNWDLPATIVFVSGLLALSIIDLEHLILPKSVIYPTLLLVTGLLAMDAALTSQWHRMLVASLCAAAWFIFFLVINLISPRYLGFGDVRLAPILGVGLGWFGVRYVILGFMAGNLLGAVIGVTLIASKRISREHQLPYGVFLALGAAVAIYAGPELLAPFRGFA